MGNLNIYACNGVGTLNSVGMYRYWTAGTTDYLNTIAFNNQLTIINDLLADYELSESDSKALQIANDVDLHICILQCLAWNVENPQQYPLARMGLVVNKMLEDGLFESNLIDDDKRADNLDELLHTLSDRVATNIVGSTTESDFLTYWRSDVDADNVNNMSDEAKERLNVFFASDRGVGDSMDDVMNLNPSDFDNMADYVKACGASFLYLWIDDIEQYNYKIRKRRKKEEEVFEYICNVCYPIYNRDSVLRLIKIGIKEQCKTTPENMVNALKEKGDKSVYLKSGGVGAFGVDDALAILAIVLIVLATTLTACMQAMQEANMARYNEPVDYEEAIPAEDDFGFRPKKQIVKGGWLVALGLGALIFFGKGKSK